MTSRVTKTVGKNAVGGQSLRWLALAFCFVGQACAGSSGGGTGAARMPSPLPESRGFDGGTQVQGGFTMTASAIEDSIIPASPNRVWSAMPAVFSTLQIETPTIDHGALTIGNPGSRISRIDGTSRLSTFLDCGTGILGPNADTYEVTMQLMVQLGGHTAGGTLVRTTIDAYARPRSAAGDPIHCASRRTLEGRIMQLITEQLALGTVGEGAAATADLTAMSPGVLPVTGDLLRVECRSPLVSDASVGQGFYAGSGNGNVMLTVDSRGRTVPVPATHVVSVQVRERRTYSVLAGVVGLVLGATAGGFYADSQYDPEAENHYGPGFVRGIGVVVGGLVGGLVGRMTGSLIRSDTWHDAPAEWAIRTSGADAADQGAVESALCPSF